MSQSVTKVAGKSLPELRDFLLDHLLNNIVPFWQRHAVDPRGGLNTCIRDDGSVVNDGTVLPPSTATIKAVLLRGYPPEIVQDITEDELRKILEVNKRLRAGAREYCLHAAVKKF